MPCTYLDITPEEQAKSLREMSKLIADEHRELNRVTRLLCELMTNFGPMIEEEANHANYDLTRLKTWWNQHQKKDKKRTKLEDKLTRMTVQARGPDRRKRK